MNMKMKLDRFGPALIVLMLLWVIAACEKTSNTPMDHHEHEHEQEHKQTHDSVYSCPMHPEVKSTKPGLCPKCNMKLEIQDAHKDSLTVSKAGTVLSRQSTITLKSGIPTQRIAVNGIIDYDRSRSQTVAVRFGGRIEKLYVRYNYQYVKKGEKVADLYSPELSTIQEEHLLLLRSKPEARLLEQSREKLRLLGLENSQISRLESNMAVPLTIAVFSPFEGYALFEPTESASQPTVSTSSSQMSSMGMNSGAKAEQTSQSTQSRIREGMYVDKGAYLFFVNDLKNVWAIASIPSEMGPRISNNQIVEIESELYPNQLFRGKIEVVEHVFEEGSQRFMRVRIPLSNINKQLKINSFFRADIQLESQGEYEVPSSAVFNTGMSAIVWIKSGVTESGAGIFRMRKVVAGRSNNGRTILFSGVHNGEELAKSAGYMVDSETILRTN